MQEKLLRFLKCWPITLGRTSCEAWTEVWVPLSHTPSGKERIEEIHFYLLYPFLLTHAVGTTWVYIGQRD